MVVLSGSGGLTAEPKPFRSRDINSVSVEVHGFTALTSGRLRATPTDGPAYVVRYVRLYVRHGDPLAIDGRPGGSTA